MALMLWAAFSMESVRRPMFFSFASVFSSTSPTLLSAPVVMASLAMLREARSSFQLPSSTHLPTVCRVTFT